MMRMTITKHVKKGLGSIVRYCNTHAPLTLLETQGVPLGNVRDFSKLDQARQLQVAARQDNTTKKTTELRKLKAQKPSKLTQLGRLEPSSKKSMERTPEPKSKEITHASRKGKVDCFEVLREATQYFDYNDYLLKNCDYIKYNSALEQMLETLREDLTAKFLILSENLLRYGMRYSIKTLESVHKVELAEKFCFFLPSCKFIEMYKKILEKM